MCHVCILLDKSLPSPADLNRALNEVRIDDGHLDEIQMKVIETLKEKEVDVNKYISEYKLEFFRNT